MQKTLIERIVALNADNLPVPLLLAERGLEHKQNTRPDRTGPDDRKEVEKETAAEEATRVKTWWRRDFCSELGTEYKKKGTPKGCIRLDLPSTNTEPMDPLIRTAAAGTLRRHHYGIQRWAAILTTVPKSHRPACLRSELSGAFQRRNASGTTHERAGSKRRMAPRITYQPTSPSTWIISVGSVSADKEAIALAKGLALPWSIKRVQWRQGTLSTMAWSLREPESRDDATAHRRRVRPLYSDVFVPCRISMAPNPLQKADHGLLACCQQKARYVSDLCFSNRSQVERRFISTNQTAISTNLVDKKPWFLTGDSLKGPYPSYVIGSGAGTLPGMLHVSRMSGRASYSGNLKTRKWIIIGTSS